jgi:hypothetical protein
VFFVVAPVRECYTTHANTFAYLLLRCAMLGPMFLTCWACPADVAPNNAKRLCTCRLQLSQV